MRIMTMVSVLLVAVVGAGCSSDDPEPTPSAEKSSTEASGESEECQQATSEWLGLYDTLAEATTLEDPSKEASTKVVDASNELLAQMTETCSEPLVTAASGANDQMARLDATITACSMVDMCGTKVDDALDATMTSVDQVRVLVDE